MSKLRFTEEGEGGIFVVEPEEPPIPSPPPLDEEDDQCIWDVVLFDEFGKEIKVTMAELYDLVPPSEWFRRRMEGRLVGRTGA